MILKTSHCSWSVEVDGPDLVVRNVTATCWGGAFDTGDDGQTESGANNNGSNPQTLGVALPVRSVEAATMLSPLAFKGPHIPWFTKIRVWREALGEASGHEGELIDNGPDVLKYPTHALDLNPPMVGLFDPDFPLEKRANDWKGTGFSFRVYGGAKFIS